MRYGVLPRLTEAGEVQDWRIWDERLSPELARAGINPVFCSLAGQELTFPSMSSAWGWLAVCNDRGLSVEHPGMTIKVYTAPAGADRFTPVSFAAYQGAAPLMDSRWPMCECLLCRSRQKTAKERNEPR